MQQLKKVMVDYLEEFMWNGSNFEFNPLPDGESMKFSKDRRNMMTAPNRRDDKPS